MPNELTQTSAFHQYVSTKITVLQTSHIFDKSLTLFAESVTDYDSALIDKTFFIKRTLFSFIPSSHPIVYPMIRFRSALYSRVLTLLSNDRQCLWRLFREWQRHRHCYPNESCEIIVLTGDSFLDLYRLKNQLEQLYLITKMRVQLNSRRFSKWKMISNYRNHNDMPLYVSNIVIFLTLIRKQVVGRSVFVV